MAVILQADCRQDRGPGLEGGRNARHMVVIKTGAAEHSVYISMLPKGMWSFMRGRTSHGVRSAKLRAYGDRTESRGMRQECIFLPVCYFKLVYSFCNNWHQVGGFL